MILRGKTAVISGGAGVRGIGFATAKLFVEQGAKVAILDIDGSAAKDAATSLGAGNIGLQCDVTDLAACQKAVDASIKALGHVDILINNAGITQPVKIMEIDPKSWDRILDVNLRGILYLSQATIPHMRARKRAPSPACRRCRRSAAAASLADRTTRRRRLACSDWPRPWRANWGPTASASTA